MHVFELLQPGTWLQGFYEAHEVRCDVESLLRLLVGSVEDAAIALSLFEQSQAHAFVHTSADKWEADGVLVRSIEAELERQLPHDLSSDQRWNAMDRIRESARAEAKRQRWRSGEVPEGYRQRMPFVHAKSFVYALDTLLKAAQQLSLLDGVPSEVDRHVKDLGAAFPDLIHVRDSAHHAEDRVRGMRRRARIDLQPVVNEVIHAPSGGVLVIDMLSNNMYGGTLGDGSYGQVEVSAESLTKAGTAVQRILDSFAWHGPPMHLPS